MKVAVWMSAVNAESDYVRKEPLRKRGPYLENPYADVDEEEEEFEIAQTIDKVLYTIIRNRVNLFRIGKSVKIHNGG